MKRDALGLWLWMILAPYHLTFTIALLWQPSTVVVGSTKQYGWIIPDRGQRNTNGDVPYLPTNKATVGITTTTRWNASIRHFSDRRTAMEDMNSRDQARQNKKERGMTMALVATYFTVMGAKCALPAVLTLLTSSNTGLTFPHSSGSIPAQKLMARLLMLSTIAIAMGKLVLGPVIDRLGGTLSLRVALTLLFVLLGIIASCQQFQLFAAAWILVDFVFSSCWAACINAIHQSFPPDQWPKQIGNLAMAARSGNAVAFAFFASILQVFQSKMAQAWRPVFAIAGVLQLIPIALLTRYGGRRDAISEGLVMEQPRTFPQNSSPSSPLRTLQRELRTLDFWLHLISRSVLMIFASFLLFVPTLFHHIYQTSSSSAAKVASLYAMGCLLSITMGAQYYDKLTTRRRKMAVILLSLTGAILSSIGQLGHVSQWWKLNTMTSAALFFLWGFSFAIPFYIPPSLYALYRGGKSSSATIADVMDIGGFGLLAGFNGYVASIQHSNPAVWIPVFQITTLCAVLSFFSLFVAAVREGCDSPTKSSH